MGDFFLLFTYGVDVAKDDAAIHPSLFCNNSYAISKKHEAASANSLLYRHSVTLFQWAACSVGNCNVRI